MSAPFRIIARVVRDNAEAEQAIAALKADGWVIVPRRATKAMIEAGDLQ